MGVLVGILILSIMMIVHELGHFLTGRRLGFKIEEFSIFMGPVLYSWQRNGIRYSIKLLPIGASVRFGGEVEDDAAAVNRDPSLFFNRPKWARAIVISTGPALNLLSGLLAFALMFAIFGCTIPVLQTVQADTLAAQAGLTAGDRILAANGERIRTALDYTAVELYTPVTEPVSLQVRSADGTTRNVTLVPRMVEGYRLGITIQPQLQQNGAVVASVDQTSNGGKPVLQAGDIVLAANGVAYQDLAAFKAVLDHSVGQPVTVTIIRNGQTQTVSMVGTFYQQAVARGIWFIADSSPGTVIGQSFQWSWSIVKLTVRSLGMVFTGRLAAKDTLSGPVGVVSLISNVVDQKQPLRDKIYQLLWMFALVSVSLGFMNLLPIPPLDGNHLVLIVVEAIRGRRLSVKAQNIIGLIGFILIIALALAGLVFDIMRLTGL